MNENNEDRNYLKKIKNELGNLFDILPRKVSLFKVSLVIFVLVLISFFAIYISFSNGKKNGVLEVKTREETEIQKEQETISRLAKEKIAYEKKYKSINEIVGPYESELEKFSNLDIESKDKFINELNQLLSEYELEALRIKTETEELEKAEAERIAAEELEKVEAERIAAEELEKAEAERIAAEKSEKNKETESKEEGSVSLSTIEEEYNSARREVNDILNNSFGDLGYFTFNENDYTFTLIITDEDLKNAVTAVMQGEVSKEEWRSVMTEGMVETSLSVSDTYGYGWFSFAIANPHNSNYQLLKVTDGEIMYDFTNDL